MEGSSSSFTWKEATYELLSREVCYLSRGFRFETNSRTSVTHKTESKRMFTDLEITHKERMQLLSCIVCIAHLIKRLHTFTTRTIKLLLFVGVRNCSRTLSTNTKHAETILI